MNYEELLSHIEKLVASRPFDDPLEIVAVTKYASLAEMKDLEKRGLTLFGENKVQDFLEKKEVLSFANHKWNFIGHLQTNKVRKIVGKCDVIQSVDSERLANKINKVAEELNINQRILLQVNIASDPQKTGFDREAYKKMISNTHLFPNLTLEGIMIVVPEEKDGVKLAGYFKEARCYFEALKTTHKGIKTLSMGMSGDYECAIKEGSTQVRLGSILLNTLGET